MKRVLLCLVVIMGLSVSSLLAQQKGDNVLGAQLALGLNSVVVDDISATAVEFGMGVDFGHFVADRFKLGLGLTYVLTGGDDTVHAITIGPSFSYYIPICDNLFYAPKLDLAFACGIYGGESVPGFGVGLSVANLEYRPTEHIGLSASMLSLSYVLMAKYGVTVNNVDLNISFSPSLGFNYYF